jgi:hypothetical protein
MRQLQGRFLSLKYVQSFSPSAATAYESATVSDWVEVSVRKTAQDHVISL